MNLDCDPELNHILVKHGANVNHRDIYGMTPLRVAVMAGYVGAVDTLMELGADITLPYADGMTVEKMYTGGGAKITAAITKWLRHRASEQAPLSEKVCAACGKEADGETKGRRACRQGWRNTGRAAVLVELYLLYPLLIPDSRLLAWSWLSVV
ncbi:hypothetical protein BV25DRAFT_1916840 [Artomyces pyxidatus]|uniref:Uncharacterized protein n=1 Tax=Artomyces pyxidatus TaxID=48021 RepID=A0ACB8SZ51_9AGAM|nr:hypothetical protein BV25DRAFT_1916840 [Artomyces pyxidatus]